MIINAPPYDLICIISVLLKTHRKVNFGIYFIWTFIFTLHQVFFKIMYLIHNCCLCYVYSVLQNNYVYAVQILIKVYLYWRDKWSHESLLMFVTIPNKPCNRSRGVWVPDSAERFLPEFFHIVAVRWQLDYCNPKPPVGWTKMFKSQGWQGLIVVWDLRLDVYQSIFWALHLVLACQSVIAMTWEVVSQKKKQPKTKF